MSISCVIKHRFSDFIVNEIDEHGTVVWFKPETELLKWRKGHVQADQPKEDQESEQKQQEQ